MSIRNLTAAELEAAERPSQADIDNARNVRDRLEALTAKFVVDWIAAGGDFTTVRDYTQDMLGDDPSVAFLAEVE